MRYHDPSIVNAKRVQDIVFRELGIDKHRTRSSHCMGHHEMGVGPLESVEIFGKSQRNQVMNCYDGTCAQPERQRVMRRMEERCTISFRFSSKKKDLSDRIFAIGNNRLLPGRRKLHSMSIIRRNICTEVPRRLQLRKVRYQLLDIRADSVIEILACINGTVCMNKTGSDRFSWVNGLSFFD